MIQINDSKKNTNVDEKDLYAIADRRFIRKIRIIIIAEFIFCLILEILNYKFIIDKQLTLARVVNGINWIVGVGSLVWFFVANHRNKVKFVKDVIGNENKLEYKAMVKKNNTILKNIKGWFDSGR
jgi:hypothetical protein